MHWSLGRRTSRGNQGSGLEMRTEVPCRHGMEEVYEGGVSRLKTSVCLREDVILASGWF
jgi:hypothetical protein